MPRGIPRDPNIKKHSAPMLRWFAAEFRDHASYLRKQAEHFEAKAVRYTNRAIDLEKE